MKRNITSYLLVTAFAFAFINPAHASAAATHELDPHLLAAITDNPGLATFSLASGIVTGIALGWKAGDIGNEAGKFVNYKAGLTRNQNFLKRLAAAIAHTGVNFASVHAILIANAALASFLTTPQAIHNYPILTTGTTTALGFFALTIQIAALVKSGRYAFSSINGTIEDDANDQAFA